MWCGKNTSKEYEGLLRALRYEKSGGPFPFGSTLERWTNEGSSEIKSRFAWLTLRLALSLPGAIFFHHFCFVSPLLVGS